MTDPLVIRVVLVGPSMDILGGQAVQVTRLLRRLRELEGIEVEFLAVNPRLPGPLRLLQRIKYVRTIATSIAYGLSLLAQIRKYDVVHAFSASYTSYLLAPLPAMLVARLYGKRIVLNYRSGEASDHLAKSPLAVRTMRLADEIVVPSGYLVEVFAQFGLHARSILNFVDLDNLDYRERTVTRPTFLSNRNLEPLYNVGCTLRAFGVIQQQEPDAVLTVVGDGSERASLEALARELGLRNVEFAGKVPPQRMREFYDAADVYLNSPNIDNMPNSVIEAFASGLPVVTTNAGGIPFIVTDGETGFMSACDDHEALARNALALVRTSGLAHAVAARARNVCLTRYVWEAVAVEWETLYRGLVRRNGVAAPQSTPAALPERR
ncbi:MAG: glycosyltransferase family 4 protein [Gemmatimonadaceae bacterium]